MQKLVREEKITGTGGMDETMAVGVLERGGNVRATVTGSRRKKSLPAHVRESGEPGAEVFTDALKSYEGLEPATSIRPSIDEQGLKSPCN